MIAELYKKYLSCQHIATDSRSMTPQAIFFALSGPHFNGNKFAEKALEKGASYAIIDDIRYKKDDRYILVDSSLATLQRLASYHRRQLNIPFIAITGSYGKTTTKELVKTVLSQCYKVFATSGNLNNHIGVPLTLLSITREAEIAVIEMGANRLGEIAQLCEIAAPTHGLITQVGNVHLEGFGSFEGVVRGKSELYHYLIQHEGQVFINSQNPILTPMGKRFKNPYYYPQKQDFYQCELVAENPYVVYKSENGEVVQANLLGAHHFGNIAAALCIAKYFEVNEEKANEAIKHYYPPNNRSQVIKRGTNTFILDAYNANPESMREAIRVFNLIPASHKILILGDMNELGEESEKFHQEIGRFTTQEKYTAVIFCGSLMEAAKKMNPSALYFENKEDLADYLKKRKFENTTFLFKASRSLGLESLAELINPSCAAER